MSKKIHLLSETKLDVSKTLFEDYIELNFLLPGFLLGSVGAIVGPGSTGKSFLAIELAATICSKGIFNPLKLDLPLKSDVYNRLFPQDIVKVVYLSGEDPLEVIHNRLVSLASFLSNDNRKRLGESFEVQSLRGKRPYLLSVKDNTVIRNEKLIDNIKKELKNFDLAIFDTLKRFHNIDENNNNHASELIDLFDEISSEAGCSILFLHHSNKVAMREGNGDDQTASRGASALTDNIRWQMNLRTMNTDEAAKKYKVDNCKNWVLLSGSKINYAQSNVDEGDFWLKRGEKGLLFKEKPKRKEGKNGAKKF